MWEGVHMSQINLLSQNIHQHTLINNLFIDHYMPKSNGDYVKVYLYLLRLICSNQCAFTAKQIAKQLHLIESDVIRAINYWNELKVIEVQYEDDQITSIGFLSLEKIEDTVISSDKPKKNKANAAKPKLYERPEYTMEEIASIASQIEFQQLIYITEKYLGKQLTQVDVNILVGFMDWLGLTIEVVEYLIEYCASNDHRHMNYIEKVAMDWSDKGIRNVKQAKDLTENFNKNYYKIFKALGLSSRNPTPAQTKLMEKWLVEYNFAIEVIEIACAKTIEAINKPELKYVDTILTNWQNKGAKSINAVKELDVLFKSDQADKQATKKEVAPKANNRFHNHNQRQYDHDLIEKRMRQMIEVETVEKRT